MKCGEDNTDFPAAMLRMSLTDYNIMNIATSVLISIKGLNRQIQLYITEGFLILACGST